MWGGAVYYDPSAYQQLIQAFHNSAVLSPPDEHARVIIATSRSAGRETGVSNIYYSRPEAAPPSLAPFTAIRRQIFNSLLGFVEEQSTFGTNDVRQLFFTTSFRLDVQLMSGIRELWLEALKLVSPSSASRWLSSSSY